MRKRRPPSSAKTTEANRPQRASARQQECFIEFFSITYRRHAITSFRRPWNCANVFRRVKVVNIFRANVCAVAGIAMMAGAMVGCSSSSKAPDVSASIRSALDQAGLKDVSESQDRDRGVVTLTGHVAGDVDKGQAESIAKSIAVGEVVANQIA